MSNEYSQAKIPPKTVRSVRPVDMVLVSYVDQNGVEVNQFAFAGDNTVLLIDRKEMGIASQERTPSGYATGWLREGILKAMGRKVIEQPPVTSTIPMES